MILQQDLEHRSTNRYYLTYRPFHLTPQINPEHNIIVGIKQLLDEKDEERARDLAELMFETSLITSGFQLESPKDYASKVFTLMKIAMGGDIEEDVPAAQPAASSSAPSQPAAKPVEAEVVDPNDPWKK